LRQALATAERESAELSEMFRARAERAMDEPEDKLDRS
jgi:hypothetical protein